MNYTINNKQYTLFDIKARCAELMDIEFEIAANNFIVRRDLSFGTALNTLHEFAQCKTIEDYNATAINRSDSIYDPCTNWNHAGPIIEKCWDELTSVSCLSTGNIEWHQLVLKHNCTKLVAACICLIELND
jgi:hypothetical protein